VRSRLNPIRPSALCTCGTQFLGLLAQLADGALDGVVSLARLGGLGLGAVQQAVRFVELKQQRADLVFRLLFLAFQLGEMLVTQMRIEHPGVGQQRLITPGLGGLTLQRAHLALHFGNDVATQPGWLRCIPACAELPASGL